MRYALVSVLALGVSGCLAQATPSQRLSETAYEFSTAARFGRMEVAVEHVAAASQPEFARQHAAWGKTLRIVDVELAGLQMRAKDDADVLLNVSWQRADEAEVRMTQVSQRWRDDRGWRLATEARKAGDTGLLGEPVTAVQPAAASSRFLTRVIPSEQ